MYNSSEEKNQSTLNTPKSRNWKHILFGLMTVIGSFYLVKHEFQSLKYIDNDLFAGVLGFLWYGLLKLALIFVLVFSIIRLIKSKMLIYLMTLLISLSTVIAIISVWVKINKRDSAPVILNAIYSGDINGMRLILRANNTYEIDDHGPFGGTLWYGQYSISNDTIYLSEEFPLGKERDVMGNKLLITQGFILIKQDEKGTFLNDYLKLEIMDSINGSITR